MRDNPSHQSSHNKFLEYFLDTEQQKSDMNRHEPVCQKGYFLFLPVGFASCSWVRRFSGSICNCAELGKAAGSLNRKWSDGGMQHKSVHDHHELASSWLPTGISVSRSVGISHARMRFGLKSYLPQLHHRDKNHGPELRGNLDEPRICTFNALWTTPRFGDKTSDHFVTGTMHLILTTLYKMIAI